jgi:hypothetical protein
MAPHESLCSTRTKPVRPMLSAAGDGSCPAQTGPSLVRVKHKARRCGALLACLALLAAAPACQGDAEPSGAATRPGFLLVSLPSLGTVTWRCGARGEYGLAFEVFRTSASTQVRWLAGGDVRRRATVHPGEVLRLPLSGTRQDLEFKQGTGAGTLRASVSVEFETMPTVSHCYRYAPPHLAVRVTPRR